MLSIFGVIIYGQEIHLISVQLNTLDQYYDDEVETRMLSETGHDRHDEEALKNHIWDVLECMDTNTELFENLLYSYSAR